MIAVLVTGSRELTDKLLVTNQLNKLYDEYNGIYLVVGDATGADSIALDWAIHKPVPYKVFEADWNRKCDANCFHPTRFRDGKMYCPAAGNIRNQQMIDFINQQMIDFIPQIIISNVVGLAFYKLGAMNRGTSDCVQRMASEYWHIERFWQE